MDGLCYKCLSSLYLNNFGKAFVFVFSLGVLGLTSCYSCKKSVHLSSFSYDVAVDGLLGGGGGGCDGGFGHRRKSWFVSP